MECTGVFLFFRLTDSPRFRLVSVGNRAALFSSLFSGGDKMSRLWFTRGLFAGVLGVIAMLGVADDLTAQGQKGGQKAGKGGGVAGGMQAADGAMKDGFGKSVSAL